MNKQAILALCTILIVLQLSCVRKNARNELVRNAFHEEVVVSCFIEPCRIEADFNRDGKMDQAFLVESVLGKKKGIAIILDNKWHYLIGAGHSFGNGGDDFLWMDNWMLYEGDSLFVENKESASAIVRWKNSKFLWQQLGD